MVVDGMVPKRSGICLPAVSKNDQSLAALAIFAVLGASVIALKASEAVARWQRQIGLQSDPVP
jgi:hypothetical protein